MMIEMRGWASRTEGRDVQRRVQDVEEQQRQLSGHRGEESGEAGLAEVLCKSRSGKPAEGKRGRRTVVLVELVPRRTLSTNVKYPSSFSQRVQINADNCFDCVEDAGNREED